MENIVNLSGTASGSGAAAQSAPVLNFPKAVAPEVQNIEETQGSFKALSSDLRGKVVDHVDVDPGSGTPLISFTDGTVLKIRFGISFSTEFQFDLLGK